MASEKNFENKVKSFLKEEGCWFLKYWGGGQFTKEGIPDILCCCNGQFMGIEIKAPNGKPSLLQIYNLKKIDEAGGFGILLYPKDFEDFKKLVKAIKDSEQQLDYDITEAYDDLKGRWKV